MAITSVDLSRTFSSFSGCDIRVSIDGEEMGAVQAVSYAVQREKAPIYVMGRVDALSFSRGKRGIAGTIITLMFDRHVLFSKVFRDKKFVADKNEIYSFVDDVANFSNGSAQLQTIGGETPGEPETFSASDISQEYQLNTAWYLDQIPPFDMSLIAMNEYGNGASMRIIGCELLNEGSGFSIDDMSIENQATYICRTLMPWKPLGKFNMTSGQFTRASIDQTTTLA